MNTPLASNAVEAEDSGPPPGDAHPLWAQFAHSRDPAIRDQLIEQYMPLARTVAARIFRLRLDTAVPFSDYLQYARVGLIEAVDRYDPAREASFETFSGYRIRGAVLNGLGKETELAAQRTFWRVRTQERMDSLKPGAFRGGDSDLDDIVQLTIGLALGILIESGADEGPADSSVSANPYAGAELAELRRIVRGAVDALPPRERDLVSRHYFAQCEFQAIAEEMGVTKGRVSQLHSQALQRIRTHLASRFDLNF
jgi:RNA polymerase sigma factor FliA